MKYTILLLICILVWLSPLFTQPAPAYIFNNRDDAFPGNYDSGMKTFYWNKGILILGFSVDTLDEYYGMTLIFYDSTGNKLWTKNIRNSNWEVLQGNDIAFTNDASFYVTGVVYQSDSLGWDMFFAKFNQQGDSVYFKYFPDTVSKFPQSMTVWSPDTILVLSGWNTIPGDDSARICIDRVDTSGNIISNWLGDPDLKYPDQILKTEANLIYVGGTRKTAPGSDYHVKVFINKYDANMNYLGAINPSFTLNEYFVSMMNNGGRVYLTSMISQYVTGYSYPFWIASLSKLWLNGVWSNQTFGVPEMDDIVVFPGIVIDSGRLAIPVWEEAHNWLIFCDTNLATICSTYMSYPSLAWSRYALSSVSSTPGHKVAGTGAIWWDQISSQDHWNFLTQDMDTYIDAHCNVGIPQIHQVIESVKVYPNPFDNLLQVESSDPLNQDAEITIYNQYGVIVSRLTMKDKLIINTSEFKPGLYLVTIMSDKGTDVRKVMKVSN